MKAVKISTILILGACLMLTSCDNDKEKIRPADPVARFSFHKKYYEEGDTVRMMNKSKHAHSFLWQIDGKDYSTDRNPIFYDYELWPYGKSFRIKLFAFDKDTSKYDMMEQQCNIARRRISDIHITYLSDELRQMIPQVADKETRLIIFLGPVEAPFEWYGVEQSLWSKPFSRDQELPWQYVHGSWATFAMNNTDWLFRFSFEVDGPDDRVTAAQFIVNPIQQPWQPYPQNPDKLRMFTLANDDININIIFSILP